MRPIKSPAKHLVPVSEFAKISGISVRRINNMVQSDGFPVAEAKTVSQRMINCPEAFKFLIDKEIRSLGISKEDDEVNVDGATLKGEQYKKTKAERIKVETENRVRAGELVETTDVKLAFDMSNVLLKNTLRGLAGKLSGGNAAKRKVFKERFDAVLTQYRESIVSGFGGNKIIEAP